MKSRSALLVALLLSMGAHGAIAKDPALLSLSLEHFRDSASVNDDPSKDSTTITTERGYVEHWGPLHMTWNDEFLKSVIDHKTGNHSYEIDVAITYSGSSRSYKTANYQATAGPETAPIALVRKETVDCASGQCMYTDHLAFPVEEQLLRRLAAGYAPGKPSVWTYQLSAKGGSAYHGRFSNAEIAGFLARVDGYDHAPLTLKDAPPLHLDFGINGLAVAAGADMPERVGVLVVSVSGGSVAQKAGIITGDIIYKFDADSIKSPSDLQAAVAGRAANSAAAIRVFRGLTEMTLRAQF